MDVEIGHCTQRLDTNANCLPSQRSFFRISKRDSRGKDSILNYKTLASIQDSIVIKTADAIHGDWDAAVVNMEVDEIEGELKQNCICLFFKKKAGQLVRESFLLPPECFPLFLSLREEMKNSEKWTICNLEFNSNGQYKFGFSTERLKRLNRISDDDN